MSPEFKMKQKEREIVVEWFDRAANTLKKRAKSIFEKVVEALRLPAAREAVKAKIKEQARPFVQKILDDHHLNTNSNKNRSHQPER